LFVVQGLTSVTFHRCPKVGPLPSEITALADLRQLTLAGCGLAELPELSGLTGLTSLDVGMNTLLDQIPDSIGYVDCHWSMRAHS
jgi:Leucine-rich repeat (LRR) protein